MAVPTTIKGVHQLADIVTENIRNYAVTAIKLNPDVAGNGIELDDLNRISFTGYTIVKNETELLEAINSGVATNISLKDGVYNLGGDLVVNRSISLIGENKKTTLISLSPDGQLYFHPTSGQVINGSATLLTESTVFLTNLDTSGTMTYGSYAGASLILDDVPYKVVSITSGEAYGMAIAQLAEPYASSSFSAKDFKLEYLLDYVVLKNIGFSSAYNDGVIKTDRVRNLVIENVEIRGSDVVNNPSQGIYINETYFGIISNTDVTLTRVTLPLNESKEYGIYVKNSRFISFDNTSIYNTNSNGMYLHLSKYVQVNDLKVSNIDGNPLRINGCDTVVIGASYFNDFGLKSTILNSDQILINGCTFKSATDKQAIEITESHINLSNNNFYNTYVKVYNSNQETIVSANEFENVVSTSNALFINGKEKAIISSNIFNTLATNALLVYSGDAIISNNYFSNATNAINIQNGSNAIVSNNTVEQNTNGVVVDDTTTNTTINNNVFTVSNNAISIASTGNFVTENTIVSGSINIPYGNSSQFLTTFEPYLSGLTDIGSNVRPVKDIYASNAVRSKNIILNNGSIFGASNIVLSGHVVTVDASHLYIDGDDLAGLSLSDIQYVHNQIIPSANWVVKHNLGTKNVDVAVYNASDVIIYPSSISNIDGNRVSVVLSGAITGRAIIHSAGSKTNNTGFTGQVYTHQQTSLAPTWIVSHNLQSKNLIIQTYDENDEMYFPSTTKFVDDNTVEIYNSYAKKGKAVIFSENAFNVGSSQYIFRQNTSGSIWTIPHNRNSKDFVITTYDDPYNGNSFTPTSVQVFDENTVYVNCSTPKVGRAVMVFPSANPQRFTDVKYTHDQPTPSTVWDILHNLSTEDVSVVMYDNFDNQILTGINYVKIIDPDYIQVQFSSAKYGKAVVVAPINSNRLSELEDDVGDLTTLNTNDQSSLVGAVNEIYTVITDNDINRNRIVNGDFIFSDEHGSYNSGIASGSYIGNIFKFNFSGQATIGWERTTTVPATNDRSQYSVRIDVMSGAPTGVDDYYTFNIPLEGYAIADTYNSSTTFSFYARSNKPGTYSLALRGSHSSSPILTTYINSFTVNALDTWEKFEFTIPADANWPSYNKDHNLGLELNIVLTAGSGYLSVAENAWYTDATTDYRSQNHNINLTEYTGGHLYLTRFKYEKGSIATNFIPGDYSLERKKMNRYYQILSGKNNVSTYVGTNNDAMIMINHRDEMRTTPTSDIRHVMLSNNNSTWVSGTIVNIDSANKYSTTLYTSYVGAYKFVGGDGTYDGTSSFVVHNRARF